MPNSQLTGEGAEELQSTDLWVFGYGSLMWRPGFNTLEAIPATLYGAHRALCIYSWVHRGTQQRPGLVLGLDSGGSCRGMAFRVAEEDRGEVLAYLRERELVTNVYREAERSLRLDGGRRVLAVAYLVDRDHQQYAGLLAHGELVQQVRGAVGQSGANEEYIHNTVAHLRELGIRDHRLEQLALELDSAK